MKIDKYLKQSALYLFHEQCEQVKFPGYRWRALEPNEIEVLHSNHNRAEDWSRIKVQLNFDASKIYGSEFMGDIFLPTFYGTIRSSGGVSLPAGIYDCTVSNCIIENSCLRNIGLLSNTIVMTGAMVQNVNSFVCNGVTTYGIGRSIKVGAETGGRTIRCFPEMSEEYIHSVIMDRHKSNGLQEYHSELDAFLAEHQSPWSVVGAGAIVCNTNIVRNSWIGSHARIDGAAKIRSSFILSRLEEPSEIFDGVILEYSLLQAGVKLHSYCQVQNSFLLSRAECGRKALVTHSVLCADCKVEEAEVTSSFVGELTQLHHHSLLISSLWPHGKGNVGYGANVGSNHTGRLPDQELIPGEAMFFGLGCSIKFPANFAMSPFSIVATGVVTLPQKLEYPFSLLNTPATQNPLIPRQYNELIPAWTYAHNAFALIRNEYKYLQRSKSRELPEQYSIWRSDIAKIVFAAMQNLSSIQRVKEIYLQEDIPGLGKNYLTEPNRLQSVQGYKQYLTHFVVKKTIKILQKKLESHSADSWDIRKLHQGEPLLREIAKEVQMPTKISAVIKLYRTLEKRWMDSCFESVAKDTVRGTMIFEDYEQVHPKDEKLGEYINQSFQQVRTNCNMLLKSLRSFAPGEE
jgi:hypothetical protein